MNLLSSASQAYSQKYYVDQQLIPLQVWDSNEKLWKSASPAMWKIRESYHTDIKSTEYVTVRTDTDTWETFRIKSVYIKGDEAEGREGRAAKRAAKPIPAEEFGRKTYEGATENSLLWRIHNKQCPLLEHYTAFEIFGMKGDTETTAIVDTKHLVLGIFKPIVEIDREVDILQGKRGKSFGLTPPSNLMDKMKAIAENWTNAEYYKIAMEADIEALGISSSEDEDEEEIAVGGGGERKLQVTFRL